MKGVDVLFCGLIREDEYFKKTIKELSQLRNEGFVNQVILSTWDYEIDNHKGMRAFLNKYGVVLVEKKEPEDKGYGNIWCQMKSMENGMKIIKPGSFVLKSRTDVWINLEYMKKLFSDRERLKIKNNLPGRNIFKFKIWVPWFEITKPFYIADECFFGYYDDVMK